MLESEIDDLKAEIELIKSKDQKIPGFPFESIIIGMLISLIVFLTMGARVHSKF